MPVARSVRFAHEISQKLTKSAMHAGPTRPLVGNAESPTRSRGCGHDPWWVAAQRPLITDAVRVQRPRSGRRMPSRFIRLRVVLGVRLSK